MKNEIVFIMAISAAFIMFAAFETSFVSDLSAVEMVLTCVHFSHFSKLVYKFFKWGLNV